MKPKSILSQMQNNNSKNPNFQSQKIEITIKSHISNCSINLKTRRTLRAKEEENSRLSQSGCTITPTFTMLVIALVFSIHCVGNAPNFSILLFFLTPMVEITPHQCCCQKSGEIERNPTCKHIFKVNPELEMKLGNALSIELVNYMWLEEKIGLVIKFLPSYGSWLSNFLHNQK